MKKPQSSEFPPYYQAYIDKVSSDDLIKSLESNRTEVLDFFSSIPEEKYDHRYEEGKWSILEVLVHLSDVERVMSYRAFRISRNDQTPIEGYDHNAYIFDNDFSHRSKDDALEEFNSLRLANQNMINHFPQNIEENKGVANGAEISLRSLIAIMQGHTKHHMNIIKERYL